ncbi:MAG: hypothetical protein K1X53_17480 [Candidatus Sumerlaeaceae bacterium]|nr:hypothetical protein [Candidatus Sumerlaeaceae bacterium]
MKKIPLTPAQVAAIRKLCPDSMVARTVLGEDDPRLEHLKKEPGDLTSDPRVRLQQVVSELLGYVETMAAELDEFPEGPDQERLRSEAVGILLAVREIYRAIPDLGEAETISSPTLIEMAQAFTRGRALLAAARLGVGDAMTAGLATAPEIAAACKADADAVLRLLRYLATFGVVVENPPDEFVLTSLGRGLESKSPDSKWAGVVFWADLLADNWSHLTECIRTGRNAAEVIKAAGGESRWSTDPEAPAIFRAVMGTAPPEAYGPIAAAFDFAGCRVVADLGGGGGALLLEILHRHPALRGILVDRPESIERAKPRFKEDAASARCELVSADLQESVPPGADIYILKHVLHGYSDEGIRAILGNVRGVIPPDGRVLVIEFVLPSQFTRVDPQIERRAMSDLNMLVNTGGRERTAVEWNEVLGSAGFKMEQVLPVEGDAVSVVVATPD